jgi:alkaline phosphatase D
MFTDCFTISGLHNKREASMNRTQSIMLGLLMLAAPVRGDDKLVLTRIAFGSCARQDKPQPIWDAVIATKPDLFLLLGDNIYGDTQDMALLKKK